MVFDRGPLNNNGAVAMALPELLVELGLFDFVLVIFLEKYHSKQLGDRIFGIMEVKLQKNDVLR